MHIKTLFPILLLPLLLLTGACAVDPEEDSGYFYDRVMKAWLNVNYPGVQPFGTTGAYILSIDRGSGPAVTDSCYVWAHYTKRDLEQTIVSTNVQSLSEQIGGYTTSTYYGSDIWRLGQGYLPDALEEILKTMRAGGSVKVALPLSASSHDYSLYTAFSSTSETDNLLVDVTIDTLVDDIFDYQDRVMREWFREHYARTDTVAEGLYLQKLEEHPNDSITDGTSVSVWYIGRLMNGQVFDTNIQDSAKFYRIYDSNKSFTALSFEYHKPDSEELTSNNSYVKGFAKALSMMKYGETAVTLFNSELGYGDKGSSPSIPEYSPLVFWLYIEPK